MTFTVLTDPDGVGIAATGGDPDIASTPAVRGQLLSLLRPRACRLVIDMSAIQYAHASGLAVPVSTRRRAVLLGYGGRQTPDAPGHTDDGPARPATLRRSRPGAPVVRR